MTGVRCVASLVLRISVGMRRAGFSHFAEAGARPLGGEGRARYLLRGEQLAVRDSGDRNQPMRDF